MTSVRPGTRSGRRLLEWPVTRAGRWGAGLVAAALFLWLVVEPLTAAAGQRLGGREMLLAAVVGGTLSLYAIMRHGERSLALLLALLPYVAAMVFLLVEVVRPH